MKPKVYIETSVISYLTARLSKDLIIAGHQQITQEWWELRKTHFDLYVSQLVIKEASAGDTQAVEKRLAVLRDLPLLQMNDKIKELAQKFVAHHALPAKAAEDAIHVAIATVHRMEYLLTWNCTHIANAEIRRKISSVCVKNGYEIPVICTPEELLSEEEDVER